MSRVAIVTGGNRGIGFEITKGLFLSTQFDYVYLTGRNFENCQKAANEILNSSENAKSKLIPFQMDLTDKDSKQKLLDHLDKEHSGYDVLVQNAAIAFKNAATEPFHEQAEITLRTNFWGTLALLEMFFSKCKPNGRIVLMSSYCSQSTQFRFKPNSFSNPMAKELYLVNSGLTKERMKELADQFVADCKGFVKKIMIKKFLQEILGDMV